MRLSVIILTSNSGKTLLTLLKRLAQQDVTEVIVADYASQDNTIAVARGFGADVTRAAGGSPGELLNAAVRLTSCDVLLFLPGSAVISADLGNGVLDYLEAHAEAIGCQFRLSTSGRLLAGVKNLFGMNGGVDNVPAFAILRDVFIKAGGLPSGENAIPAFLKAIKTHGALPVLRQHITVTLQ